MMRTLDQKTEDIKTEIDRCSQKYRQEVGKMSESERGQELGAIQEMFKKAIENSDNKVQMAMQMYEMVRVGSVNVVYCNWYGKKYAFVCTCM